MTYGEFWPLYHQVVGTATKPKPMSAAEFRKLHDSWAKGGEHGHT